MKKYIVLLTLSMVLVFSVGAMAEQNLTDGMAISFSRTGTVDPGSSNANWHQDGNPTTTATEQRVSVEVNASAHIPCYLEMIVVGNWGTSTAKSFGPGATTTMNPTGQQYEMAFDNELGGFVDGDWAAATPARGENAEIEPGLGYFITACDTFQVNVYSNDDYKYVVKSAPLEPVNPGALGVNADPDLDLYMRYGTDMTDFASWVEHVFDGSTNEKEICQAEDCESITYFHQFKVPYTRTTAHGKYTGSVTFEAYTI